MQNAESLSAQNAESLSAQNAESPWCTVQSAESLMPTPQCRFSDVERRVQSAAENRVFFSVLPQIFGWGAGGKNSRKVGKWESGKVAKSRFLKFPDFSCFSLFEKMRKFHFSKAPPFDFFTSSENSRIRGKIKGGGL